MKKFAKLLLIATLCTTFIFNYYDYVYAVDISDTYVSYVEYLENGYYIETVIKDVSSYENFVSVLSTTHTVTKTKTTYMKNSSGSILWSVSITATFKYDGSSSKCTACSHKTSVSSSVWSIKSSSSSKSGNTATAKVIAVHTDSTGTSSSVTKSVTIKCSASGVVS